MTHEQKVAQRIKELCDTYQLTVPELARKAHMSPRTIHRLLEADSTYQPQFRSLFKICRGFGISLHEFFDTDLFSGCQLAEKVPSSNCVFDAHTE